MTDNEIIKALECCSEAVFKEDCKKLKCPFFDNEIYDCMNVDDENAMHRYSLDLINRQKAEIERLQSRETRWLVIAAHLGRIEELRMKLFKFSNMNLEEIIEYFAKGYTLVPPEPPNFNELAKFAEEMTEESNDKRKIIL